MPKNSSTFYFALTLFRPCDQYEREGILVYQEIKTRSIERFTFSNISKFSENLQRQEYFRKISWKHSRDGIASQLSLDDVNEKKIKSLDEGSFLEEKNI